MKDEGKKKLSKILEENNGMIPGGKTPIADDELDGVAGGYTEPDSSLPSYNYWIACPYCDNGDYISLYSYIQDQDYVLYRCDRTDCQSIFKVDSQGNITGVQKGKA